MFFFLFFPKYISHSPVLKIENIRKIFLKPNLLFKGWKSWEATWGSEADQSEARRLCPDPIQRWGQRKRGLSPEARDLGHSQTNWKLSWHAWLKLRSEKHGLSERTWNHHLYIKSQEIVQHVLLIIIFDIHYSQWILFTMWICINVN